MARLPVDAAPSSLKESCPRARHAVVVGEDEWRTYIYAHHDGEEHKALYEKIGLPRM